MKTFKEFLDEGNDNHPATIKFGKKDTKKIQKGADKIASRVSRDLEKQRKKNPDAHVIANFNQIDKKTGEEKYSEPGSIERQQEIEAMLQLTKRWKKGLK